MSEADASADRSTRGWRLPLFESTHPLNRSAVAANLTAGISLAALNIPQAMGYAKIAGMPVITGLYTLLLPVVAFAAFGSSRYLVVASDSATAAILAGGLTGLASAGNTDYIAFAGLVALLTAVLLLLAWMLKLGFLADFLSRTVLIGFLTGVGFQVGIAVLSEMLGLEVHGSNPVNQLLQIVGQLPNSHIPTLCLSAGVTIFVLVLHRFAPRFPGALIAVVVYWFGSDLFYANFDRFAGQAHKLVTDSQSPVTWLVVDAAAITSIDYTAGGGLKELDKELDKMGVTLVFAHINENFRADLECQEITEVIGPTRMFETLRECLTAYEGRAGNG